MSTRGTFAHVAGVLVEGGRRHLGNGNAYEIVVRATGDPRALLGDLRAAVLQFDDRLAFSTLETMETLMAQTIDDERYRAMLSGFFGLAAALLTAVGLYGLLSRTVDERRREIGLRLAVGARPAEVVRSRVDPLVTLRSN